MNRLNKEQHSASLPLGGINLVIAGAGTGKTKTLVEKVKNLIKSGYYSQNDLLVLTFSRKAAGEIRERVKSGLGEEGGDIITGTFHAFCLGLLKENCSIFLSYRGFKTFPGVISDEDKRTILASLVKERLKKLLGIPADVACNLVMKYNDLNKYTVKKLKEAGIDIEIRDIIDSYNNRKVDLNLMDYDDMVNNAIELLKTDIRIRDRLINRFRYILIDEFQDTSLDNFDLINLLLPKKNRNLFAVGDDWQSIYGFRKAEIGYIIKMKSFFPEVKIHRLRINYRSKREIVDVSNRFIKKNRVRTKKKLVSSKGRGGIVNLFTVKDFIEEGNLINDILIKELMITSDIAVLFRNNWQIKRFKKFLCGRADRGHEGAPEQQVAGVNLMTIHSSKGLEFETVIIAGVADSIIPDRSSDIEEERRLFYVALTRSKERLHVISHLDDNNKLSRFADELGVVPMCIL